MIAAEDVGEFVGDVVVVAALLVGVAIARIEIGWRLAVFAIGAIDREAVEGANPISEECCPASSLNEV